MVHQTLLKKNDIRPARRLRPGNPCARSAAVWSAVQRRLGNWEIDTSIGSGNSSVLLVTTVERCSHLKRIGYCRQRSANGVTGELMLTLMADNVPELTAPPK